MCNSDGGGRGQIPQRRRYPDFDEVNLPVISLDAEMCGGNGVLAEVSPEKLKPIILVLMG